MPKIRTEYHPCVSRKGRAFPSFVVKTVVRSSPSLDKGITVARTKTDATFLTNRANGSIESTDVAKRTKTEPINLIDSPESTVSNGRDDSDILFKYPKGAMLATPIYKKDLTILASRNYLTDAIIEVYGSLLIEDYNSEIERTPIEEPRDNIYLFSPIFFTHLFNSAVVAEKKNNSRALNPVNKETFRAIVYNKVAHWTNDVDIFQYRLLVIPVNMSKHWSLAVIEFELPREARYSGAKIYLLDSLGNLHNKDGIRRILLSFLNHEWYARKIAMGTSEPWPKTRRTCRTVNTVSTPTCSQRDADDSSHAAIPFTISRGTEEFQFDDCKGDLNCPRQSDSYNCGVYVLYNILSLTKYLATNPLDRRTLPEWFRYVTLNNSQATELRNQILIRFKSLCE